MKGMIRALSGTISECSDIAEESPLPPLAKGGKKRAAPQILDPFCKILLANSLYRGRLRRTNVGAKHLAEVLSIIPGLISKCFARLPKGSHSGRLGLMPIFVSGKNFTRETKVGLYPNLLYRIASGNTGKAFGD
jgi:hypothetical protein